MGAFNLRRNHYVILTPAPAILFWSLENFVFVLRIVDWESLIEVFFASYTSLIIADFTNETHLMILW